MPSETPVLFDNYFKPMLRILCRDHPRFVELKDAAAKLSLTYAAAEKLAEDIEALGAIEISGATYAPNLSLTKSGRDFCLKHGLDK